MYNDEQQYLDLINEILENGTIQNTRNGKTKSIFGYMMKYDLSNGKMPLLTTKKVAWKTCFRELMWFISGSTSNEVLREKKVKIWDANASRDFLDSRNLHNLKENDLGPVYGHQWRFYNAEYNDCDTDYSGKGVDQLQNIIDALNDPSQHSSRRLLMCAWNPCQIDEMALPPCHVLAQFSVRENKYLSCSLYQRSGDVGLGVPFNIASYSFLTHILAKHCNLVADKFVHFLGDAHIYEDHIDALKFQVKKELLNFPIIKISNRKDNINDYHESDIEWITEYVNAGENKMNMIA